MVDSAYILVVVILISIFLVYIFTQYTGDQLSLPMNTYKYIKTKDDIISVPHDVLDATLARYRNMLIRHCNSGYHVDDKIIRKLKDSLASHVKIKYGIEYKLFPDELEIYILNLGVRQSNQYDAELVGGIDLSDSAKSLGIIIWYLERIAMNNKNNPHTIEVPFCIQDLDDLVNMGLQKNDISAEIKMCKLLPDGIAPELLTPDLGSYGMTDVPDKFETARRSVGNAPIKCSETLRSNLHDYISDSAAQAYHRENMGAGNVSSKTQNAREASANWRNINHSRMADTSHDRDDEFGESNNRDLGPYLSYANYNLSMGLMRRDFANRRDNQKQEIGDDWSHIEDQIFTQ